MTTILGIDVQPTRLGFAVMVDGKPHDCWTTHIDGYPTKIAAALADCPPRIDRIAREWPITRFVSHARRYGAVEARLDDAIFGMWPDVDLVAYKPTEWKVRCGLPGNADKARMEAELADNGGVAVFPVLVDLETDEIVGEKVFVFANKFNYGTRTVFLVERDGGTEWVNAAYRKDATYTKKGLKKAYVIAEAFIGHKDNDPFNKLPVERGMPAGPIHYHAIRKPATYNWKEEAA